MTALRGSARGACCIALLPAADIAGMFTILIDGDCPVCKKEGDLLMRLDAGRKRLAVEDISGPDFDPSRYGIAFEEAMGTIHGVTEDGRVVTGMEVFRRAYSAVGWGWLWAPTGWPGLKQVSDLGYRWFAKNRLRLTGRRDACASGRCNVCDAPASG